MKKLLDITVTVFEVIIFYFIAFSGLLWLYYKILDAWEAMHVETDLPEPKGKERIAKTTYPDNPAKNLNEWHRYINRQLN